MKCKECGRIGFKGQKGLDMHIGRVHTKTIPTANQKHKRINAVPLVAIDSEVRRLPVLSLATPKPVTDEGTAFCLNFCPQCAFPISIVDEALAEQNVQTSRFCAGCAFPVNIVHTAMRVANKYELVS